MAGSKASTIKIEHGNITVLDLPGYYKSNNFKSRDIQVDLRHVPHSTIYDIDHEDFTESLPVAHQDLDSYLCISRLNILYYLKQNQNQAQLIGQDQSAFTFLNQCGYNLYITQVEYLLSDSSKLFSGYQYSEGGNTDHAKC